MCLGLNLNLPLSQIHSFLLPFPFPLSPHHQRLVDKKELFLSEQVILQYLGYVKTHLGHIEGGKHTGKPKEKKLFYHVSTTGREITEQGLIYAFHMHTRTGTAQVTDFGELCPGEATSDTLLG